MNLLYKVPDSAEILELSNSVIAHLTKYQQLNEHQPEAGGQLFGHFKDDTTVVIKATGPRKSDRRQRFSFRPNRKAERLEVFWLHRKGFHYVGDWHTHPQKIPTPSATDIESMTDSFSKSKHQLTGFTMVIVGTAEPPDGFYVGICNGNSCRALVPITMKQSS